MVNDQFLNWTIRNTLLEHSDHIIGSKYTYEQVLFSPRLIQYFFLPKSHRPISCNFIEIPFQLDGLLCLIKHPGQ